MGICPLVYRVLDASDAHHLAKCILGFYSTTFNDDNTLFLPRLETKPCHACCLCLLRRRSHHPFSVAPPSRNVRAILLKHSWSPACAIALLYTAYLFHSPTAPARKIEIVSVPCCVTPLSHSSELFSFVVWTQETWNGEQLIRLYARPQRTKQA